MWIVALALRRPYSFIVLAVLILLLGVFVILRTAIDIFPNIKIPVVAAIWSYTGLSPDEMSKRIVLFPSAWRKRRSTMCSNTRGRLLATRCAAHRLTVVCANALGKQHDPLGHLVGRQAV